MRNVLPVVFCFVVLVSCHHQDSSLKDLPVQVKRQPTPLPERIEEVKPFMEFRPFWNYYSKIIQLNNDFLGYDKDRKQISKLKFLDALRTGKFQPVVINPTDSLRYQLKPSPPGAERDIGNYMKLFAEEQLVFYKMEKQPVPEFNFKTIDGVKYTSENTKGKIVLFKCWFISCATCVKEMPELNDLVKNYQDRKDIVFLSLATDDSASLKRFLKNTKFSYEVAAKQGSYMSKKLHVSAYPAHFLIDRQGRLVKVSNSASEIIVFFEKLLKEEKQAVRSQ